MELLLDHPRFTFPGYFRTPSWCRLRVFGTDGRYVIIATDVATNAGDDTGTSITNAAEAWATIAWALFGRPQDVVFVEHYQAGRYGTPDLEETFAEVKLAPIDGGRRLADPQWAPLDRDGLEEMIGQELT